MKKSAKTIENDCFCLKNDLFGYENGAHQFLGSKYFLRFW